MKKPKILTMHHLIKVEDFGYRNRHNSFLGYSPSLFSFFSKKKNQKINNNNNNSKKTGILAKTS